MKSRVNLIRLIAGMVIVSGGITTRAEEKPTATPTPGTAAPSAEAAPPPPLSVFVIPASPKEGRNPFFPKSNRDLPDPTTKQPDRIETYPILLNGLTGTPRRTAMINSRTFEIGERADIRLPNGSKISIECLEIRDDAAVIKVGEQRRELRLRNGL